MATDLKRVERPQFREILVPVAPVLLLLGLMWIVQVVNGADRQRLDRFGIRPRQLDGLAGILFSPFLHASFRHLIANTLPFLVLGAILAFNSTRRFVLVTLIVALVAGLGTWLVSPANTVVVGASGVVFGYLTCIVTRGVFARKLSYVLGGLVVLVVYGSIFFGLFPSRGISWQDHLFGAIGGILAAWIVYGRGSDRLTARFKPATV